MDLLRRAFRDITAGHTRAQICGQTGYIRHLSYGDQINFDEHRQKFYDEARSIGVLTDEERLEQLKRSKQWGDEQEQELTRARQYVDSLREGKRKARHLMPSMVADYLKKIEAASEEYEKKLTEKLGLIGLTCESSADREVNDYYIVTNIFSDSRLKSPLFPEEEFGYFSQEKVNTVALDYKKAMDALSEFNLKKLAMSPFFQQYFNLVGENLHTFFGKPICQLTFYQRDVLRYGLHFRTIYNSNDISKWKPEVLEDPDLLTEYASTVNLKKDDLAQQGANDPGTMIVGIKNEDVKALGVKSTNPIQDITKKFGGNFMEWASNAGTAAG